MSAGGIDVAGEAYQLLRLVILQIGQQIHLLCALDLLRCYIGHCLSPLKNEKAPDGIRCLEGDALCAPVYPPAQLLIPYLNGSAGRRVGSLRVNQQLILKRVLGPPETRCRSPNGTKVPWILSLGVIKSPEI